MENDSAVGLVHAISEQLVSLADDVHALSRQLHPSIIDDLGLAEACDPSAPAFRGEKELQSNVSLTIFLPICLRTLPSASIGWHKKASQHRQACCGERSIEAYA